MNLQLQPITFAEAAEFVRLHHRHHLPPVGWKFGMAANDGEKVVGVAMVGRPVARHLDDGWTVEMTRLCTDGSKHAASMLAGASRRAARALGYKRCITYLMDSEPGTSLLAAGWECVGLAGGGSWNRPSRPRVDKHPLGQRVLWETAW